ncbi:hypothetical protein K490DRAFT_67472 [Saccharata proteae CBS 121410]|uniref:Uncharacterized protein n=1 Tax=Saccharata proteae CBS 121410 TaxID=1314787 RepID=A0A9P4LVP8_9PEZI|nr:hypothetical protein K490DRAFT_67472 [Saccharata proteae CBS 121410]
MDPDVAFDRNLFGAMFQRRLPSQSDSDEISKQQGNMHRASSIMDLPLEIRRIIYLKTIWVRVGHCPRTFSNLNAFHSRENGRTPQSLLYSYPNGIAAARCLSPSIIRANRQIHREFIQEIFHRFKLQLFVSNCPTHEVYCRHPLTDRHVHSIPPALSLPPFAAKYLTSLVLTFSMESHYRLVQPLMRN